MTTESTQRKLAKELVKLCGMVRGSLVHTGKKCGRSACECTEGKLHPFCYLSRSRGGSRKKRKGLKRCDGTVGGPEDIIRLLVASSRQ